MRLTTLYSIGAVVAIVFLSVLGALLDRFQVGDFTTLIVFLIVVIGIPAIVVFFGERLLILLKAQGHEIIEDDRGDNENEDEMISLNLEAHGHDINEDARHENENENEDEMISLKLTDK